MSAKSMLRIVIVVGLIMAIFIVVPVLASKSASTTVSVNAEARERLDKLDNIYLNPPVPLPANYYVGSDYIERHTVSTLPDNYYVGSDYIERHPVPTLPDNYYTGSDWIERHPSPQIP